MSAAVHGPEQTGPLWRAIVKALYESCGSPAVAGRGSAEVNAVLAGQAPVDEDFAYALMDACRPRQSATPVQARAAAPQRAALLAPVRFVPERASTPLAPTATFGYPGAIGRPLRTAAGGEVATLLMRLLAESPIPPNTVKLADALKISVAELSETVDALGGYDAAWARARTEADAAAARPAPQPVTRRRPRKHRTPVGAPPGPEQADDVAGFITTMRELREWSGLSLRQVEDASREVTDGARDWIARSTLSDMLSPGRASLPREQLLAAYTAALGLPPYEQERWERARRRLAGQEEAPAPCPPAPGAPQSEAPATRARRTLPWRRKGTSKAEEAGLA